ncbi:copper-binding protein [Asticcacaulis sp. EMRT-3]|uniref:copper-binding protein n=1 Tax=Asticcacaulis sp. EMRT-3 TaxID=3040349 RepID=UPI0024AF56BD|nr:copper-binding protein [Asticcacaulis sp. EMRT-3]MDI7776535.1 copper-binding protein [Asticcacaulis sp. EMRT-3]
MMRAFITIAIGVSLLAAAPLALADDMNGMAGMSMSAVAVKTGKGVGTITAIDIKAGKLTIQHGPIPAVGWPAMTMAFKATPATLLKMVKVGQKIAFDVKVTGMVGEVTAIAPK